MLRRDILGLGRVGDGVVELGTELFFARLADAVLDLIDWHAFDPLPSAFPQGEDAVGAVDDHVLAARRIGRAQQDGQEAPAVLGAGLFGRQGRADDLGGRRQDIGHADHLPGRGAGGHLAGPTGDEGHLEAAFPDVMLASAERTVDPQTGFDRGRLQETLVLRPAHAPVVAGEDDERVLRRSDLIEGDEEAGDALVKLVDPIAEGAGRAFPGEVLVGRDGVVHRDRREIEQEGLVLGLGLEPGGGFVGEHLHHALVLPSRRVQFEDLRLAVFGVLRPVARLIIVAVSRGSGDLHARGNLSGAQAVHEAVFDVDARQVAVIARDAEVIVEADVQRPRGEFGLVIRAPLRVFVLPAVTQVPFADGGGAVALGFEQGGKVDAGRLDVQG